MMPNADTWYGFFYPILTLMIGNNITKLIALLLFQILSFAKNSTWTSFYEPEYHDQPW